MVESHHFKTGKYQLSNGNEAINSKDLRLPRHHRAFLIRQETNLKKLKRSQIRKKIRGYLLIKSVANASTYAVT
jgi:hypothetical protein